MKLPVFIISITINWFCRIQIKIPCVAYTIVSWLQTINGMMIIHTYLFKFRPLYNSTRQYGYIYILERIRYIYLTSSKVLLKNHANLHFTKYHIIIANERVKRNKNTSSRKCKQEITHCRIIQQVKLVYIHIWYIL